jgi:hypothetical protein
MEIGGWAAIGLLGTLALTGWVLAWYININSGLKDDLLNTYRQAWLAAESQLPRPNALSQAARPTTTPASREGPSAADFAKLAWELDHSPAADATNPGSPASSSPPRTPASSPLPGTAPEDWLSHVARCSGCRGSAAVLRSLCRTLARDAAALEESTSRSAATNSSAAPEQASAMYGFSSLTEGLAGHLYDQGAGRCSYIWEQVRCALPPHSKIVPHRFIVEAQWLGRTARVAGVPSTPEPGGPR